MSEQWFYSKGDDNFGPFSIDEMQEYADDGTIESVDLVWRDGWAEWKVATEVEELGLAEPTPSDDPPVGPPPLPPKRIVVDLVTIDLLEPLADTVQEMVSRSFWNIFLFGASGCFFVALFVPWWSISWSSVRADAGFADENNAEAIFRDERIWYSEHLSPRKLRRFDVERHDRMIPIATAWLWGWNTGAGVTGFVLLFFILPVAIVPHYVRLLRPWAWIGRFALVIPGFALFIVFMLWFFGAPSDNIDPILAQGLILGPYISLLGALSLLTAGIAGGIYGLIEFVQALRVRAARSGGFIQ